MTKQYLNIIYRICAKPSLKSPIYPEDKLTLTLLCLTTFIRALKDVNYKITFILDSCPYFYRREIERLVGPDHHFVEADKMGMEASNRKAIELACLLPDDEKVYFAEDDYLYLPGAGKKLFEALDCFDFITLYDHLDYYSEPHASAPMEIKLLADHHWVSRISTTNTFGVKAGLLKRTKDIFIKYGCRDFDMWRELTQTYYLFSPIPSLATHLVRGKIAPCINWWDIQL